MTLAGISAGRHGGDAVYAMRASSRTWFLSNCTRLGNQWGPLAGVPVKLAVLLTLGALELTMLLASRDRWTSNGWVSLSASVALTTKATLIALVIFVIQCPANGHGGRGGNAEASFVSLTQACTQPRFVEVLLAITIAACELAFSWQVVGSLDGGLAPGVEVLHTHGGGGGGLFKGGAFSANESGLRGGAAKASSSGGSMSLLFPMMHWVGIGCLGPLFSCEIFSVAVGLTANDSLMGGFGPTAGLHAVVRCMTATWIVVTAASTMRDSFSGEDVASAVLAAVAAMATFAIASVIAYNTWHARRSHHTDQSTMRGFLSYLSHECRVPLQVITAGMDMLQGPCHVTAVEQTGRRGMLTRSQMKQRALSTRQVSAHEIMESLGGMNEYLTHVRAIQMATESIHAVLNDTLDLHKYTITGQISMTPTPFDFIRALEETVDEARLAEFGSESNMAENSFRGSLGLMIDHAAEAELDYLHSEMGAREKGDEQRLRQAIMNLISFACRQAPTGESVEVTLSRATTVSMKGRALSSCTTSSDERSGNGKFGSDVGSTGAEDDENVGLIALEVRVTMRGANFSERHLKALPAPYSSKDDGEEGVQLAMSRLIAQQHNGKISMSSGVDSLPALSLEVCLPLVRDVRTGSDVCDAPSEHDEVIRDERIDMAYTSSLFCPSAHAPSIGNSVNGKGKARSSTPAQGGSERERLLMANDLSNGAVRCMDGADRAPRTMMKRASWEGERANLNPFNNIMGYPQQNQSQKFSGNLSQPFGRGGNSASEVLSLREPRVLLVDDDRLVRVVLGALLRRLGAVCETACHGIEAIEKVKTTQPMSRQPYDASFDLIIMDVRMPQMNGIEATRILRDAGFVMPIVGLTANTLPEDTALFIESGATEVLYKPMSIDTAGKLLRRYMPHTGEDSCRRSARASKCDLDFAAASKESLAA